MTPRPSTDVRSGGGTALTPTRLLDAAEELFATYGVGAVSTRQILQRAGAGNNVAVTYHFGGREGLIRAVSGRHLVNVNRRRETLNRNTAMDAPVASWVRNLIDPLVEEIKLANGGFYARFLMKAFDDPQAGNMIRNEHELQAGRLFVHERLAVNMRAQNQKVSEQELQNRLELAGKMTLVAAATYEEMMNGDNPPESFTFIPNSTKAAVTAFLLEWA
jgi:AcrR family transcriptional regulator